jgi:hypothetical protein
MQQIWYVNLNQESLSLLTVKRDNLLETCVDFWLGAVAQRKLTRKGEVPLN